MGRLNDSITDVPGILVGQAQDESALTGCTVVLCRKGAVAGVDQRGGAPGTRETDLLRPMHLVRKIHAVMLAGGSAFGLDAASGAMRWLEERKIGFATVTAKVPIVAAAILYDLAIGDVKIRPDAEMGYRACQAASAEPPAEGNAGAGTGCTVGKIFGMAGAVKSGIGSASMECGGGVVTAALVAVNAFGDVIDPAGGGILAGVRPVGVGLLRIGGSSRFADTLSVMRSRAGSLILGLAEGGNTVIGVVATNALLSKEEANKVAQMAQDGLARSVRPAHTMLDGDTIFALSTGGRKAPVSLVGACAAEVFARAVVKAVQTARSAGGIPAAADVR
ncbi:MAG: P1 family peptidase [Anaerolineales bacterium]|nr:P1 family peptidase [Anaerolineales bacterium]